VVVDAAPATAAAGTTTTTTEAAGAAADSTALRLRLEVVGVRLGLRLLDWLGLLRLLPGLPRLALLRLRLCLSCLVGRLGLDWLRRRLLLLLLLVVVEGI
jgi:hypothetical protein